MLQYMCMHLQQPRVHALQQWLESARYFLTLSKPPLAIWGLTVFVLTPSQHLGLSRDCCGL